MSVLDIETAVGASPLFQGLTPAQLREALAGAHEEYFAKGRYIFRQGGQADRFLLLREGRVGLEIGAPGKTPATLETLGPGDALGWSWLVPPYAWHFDARAIDQTLAVVLDAARLRGLIDADAEVGRLLTRRFLSVVVDRLQATRLQLLDMYASPLD